MQGNYDAFMKTRSELEENQMKRYQWEKDQMHHMKVRKKLIEDVYDTGLQEVDSLCLS